MGRGAPDLGKAPWSQPGHKPCVHRTISTGSPARHWPPGGLVRAGHAPKLSVAPVPGESLPVPLEEAELGGCHQVHLPGPGLGRDFLCRGNKETFVMYRTHPRWKLPEEDKRRQGARPQGFELWKSLSSCPRESESQTGRVGPALTRDSGQGPAGPTAWGGSEGAERNQNHNRRFRTRGGLRTPVR